MPQPLPLTLGSDLSGEIAAVGQVFLTYAGDQVYGVTNSRFIGAYTEYAVALAGMVSRKPTSLTHIEAASVPVTAITAWQALFDQGELKKGQAVVIQGAAGNVGAYAVKMAVGAGVRTIATAAKDDFPFLRNLGADTLINYRAERFEDKVRDADAVIDLVGGETQIRSFQVLRRGGKLISAVSRSDQQLAQRRGISKSGDPYLRKLLVQCSHYVLGHWGPDSALRQWGLAKSQGGKKATLRAIVAVARKLSVLLHPIVGK